MPKEPKKKKATHSNNKEDSKKNQILCAYFQGVKNCPESDKKSSKGFNCASCGNTYSQALKSGTGNLWNHLRSTHPNHASEYEKFQDAVNLAKQVGVTAQLSMKDFFDDPETRRRALWLNAGISENLPFTFVESAALRLLVNDKGMSVET
jgi:hypothetical protein